MLTKDQDVTLDEMARKTVEWMDGWEWKGLDHQGTKHDQPKFVWVEDTGRHKIPQPAYWHKLIDDLNVIREVEEALNGEFEEEYIKTLRHSVIDFDYATSISYGDVFKCATADPETRLRAIYQTLRESGEI